MSDIAVTQDSVWQLIPLENGRFDTFSFNSKASQALRHCERVAINFDLGVEINGLKAVANEIFEDPKTDMASKFRDFANWLGARKETFLGLAFSNFPIQLKIFCDQAPGVFKSEDFRTLVESGIGLKELVLGTREPGPKNNIAKMARSFDYKADVLLGMCSGLSERMERTMALEEKALLMIGGGPVRAQTLQMIYGMDSYAKAELRFRLMADAISR